MQKISFTLTGRPISKKNSKNIFRNRFTGKIGVASKKKFFEYEASCLQQIMILRNKGIIPRELIKGKINIDVQFFLKGKFSVDIDNAYTSILDILQKANIIEDDKNVFSGSFSKSNLNDTWESLIVITKLEG